ncbi:MAG: hypothetical protein EOO11_08135 [Chitinophagaceae bacterium]|nr:MAG: hypothetical protein EOO11_08135 [Chitinophagaceae bacterium]
MKTILSLVLFLSFLCLATTASAQSKKQSFKVAGECGMCQKTIEKAAKAAGATSAAWDVDTKLLTVSFKSTATNTAKIQKAIADAGYDTPGFTATEEAYKSLHACCQYERAGSPAASCCASDGCKQTGCMSNGKCAPDQSCCKEGGCATKACCTKSDDRGATLKPAACCVPAAACCAPAAPCCAKA